MVVATREEAAARTPLATMSTYLKFLPAIYSESDFLGRFLMIFESIMGPLEGMSDNLKYYFDPGTTPSELLPWLASWIDLVLDESWPLERRRRLVKSAVELYQWRGTRHGLSVTIFSDGANHAISLKCRLRCGSESTIGWWAG